uniref:HAT C-terminal dimerisation domain-containing protein n=1 Tax=Biomphalaria glabrata TaxID=6526 RepID=A0A2C9LZ39_BIOGL
MALDESTVVTDTAYRVVFIRRVDKNWNNVEELLDTTCLKNWKLVLTDFEHRFQLFTALEPQFFVATPFAVDVKNVPEEVQMELLDLQCDTVLKQKYTDVGVPDFYQFLPREVYKFILRSCQNSSDVCSTYVCEQFFSRMKINRTALQSRLTDEHLALRLATTGDFRPNVDGLVSAKRSQLSGHISLC